MDAIRLFLDRLDTPIGCLVVVADGERRLRALDWADEEPRRSALLARHCGAAAILEERSDPDGFTAALRAYFDGDLEVIDDLPIATAGTPFQREVWAALRGIPCGTTISYGELARRVGRPDAVRAVGLANGANPIGIVVPCHRVIGADGSLTGYGGGIARKRWLLAHEAARRQPCLAL
jgi:methylated-DNA-[protein]-cysteine S-methyltransferase